jgi:hypothetical protein
MSNDGRGRVPFGVGAWESSQVERIAVAIPSIAWLDLNSRAPALACHRDSVARLAPLPLASVFGARRCKVGRR